MKNRIKRIRSDLHLTQQSFAEALGISRNNVAGYEAGTRSPSDAVVSLICGKFNVREQWLRTGDGEMLAESDSFSLDDFVKSHGGTDLELEILKTYFEIDPKIRKILVEHFRAHFAKHIIPDTSEELEAQCPPVEDNDQAG